jgi:hypothetical protein
MNPHLEQQPEKGESGLRALLPVLALVVLVIAFFWKMVFTDLILPRGDTFLYFYPYWQYRNLALRTARLPLWNPYLFMGVPFLANSQAGVLYPPNWPLIGFDAPTAVKISIVIHVIWAAVGMYIFARKSLAQTVLGAVVSAALFALGGYLTAQVEHINQLQGLAWLPWLFWLLSRSLGRGHRSFIWLALAFAMQLLAGHTQATFISGVGLGIWAAWLSIGRFRENHPDTQRRKWGYVIQPVAIVGLAGLLALGLAAAQLAPTWELTRLSNRGGGLTALEAVSFSFRPTLLGRGLLPFFGESLFSEYIGYLGVVGLLLGLLGLWNRRGRWQVLGLAVLAASGLFLALGAYNPFYWMLVRFIPGFSLFRAPARWLVLWAFAMAAAAGTGIDWLSEADVSRRFRVLRYVWPGIVVVGLAGLSFLAPLEIDEVPGAIGPTVVELALWGVSLLASFVLIGWIRTARNRRVTPGVSALAALAVVELFLAGRSLPYNDLSAPAAWSAQRPVISTLLAASADSVAADRFLSISDTLFDPGDLREIEANFGPYLSEDALFDYIVATKQKEILAPNLPLAWGIPAVDGFDGGILPTRDYMRFTALFLPEEDVSPDGRLRENLDGVPALSWLQMANVRWIITDKVFDAWIGGIYYDLQFPGQLTSNGEGQPAPLEAYPSQSFEATGVGLVGSWEGEVPLDADRQIGVVSAFPVGGGSPLTQPLLAGALSPDDSTTVSWGSPIVVDRVEVALEGDVSGTLTVRGLTLIDERSGAFVPTTISPDHAVRLAYSGDVKIYEYRDTHPRAYLVCDPEVVDSPEAAWERLAENPGTTVLVANSGDSIEGESGCQDDSPGQADITSYEQEKVSVEVDVQGGGAYLVLLDAWYPGWAATVDGRSVDISQANGLFRAVPVPEGHHVVEFVYRSAPLLMGGVVSLISLAGIAVFLLYHARSHKESGTGSSGSHG